MWWVLLAGFVGGIIGMMVMALCAMSGRAALEEEIMILKNELAQQSAEA